MSKHDIDIPIGWMIQGTLARGTPWSSGTSR